MMRAVAYIRVSSEEQLDGHSLEAQQRAIRLFCDARGYTVVKTYEERGRSGKTAHRPEFQAMIAAAERGAFDVIVVHKLDRFSRSLLDTLTYLGRLDKVHVSFVSASEDFDFTTPMGRVMLALLGGFAQWYLDNLSTEIVKGKHERARKGYHNGRLAFGYTTPKRLEAMLITLGTKYKAGQIDQAEYAHRCNLIESAIDAAVTQHETAAVPDPVTSHAIAMMFNLYASGNASHVEVANALNDQGYRSNGKGNQATLFTSATVSDMLNNRFYTGYTSYGAGLRGHDRRKASANIEWIKGNHEPLITESIFEAAQSARGKRADRFGTRFTWKERQVNEYPLGGLLWCPTCGVAHRSKVNRGVPNYWHESVKGICEDAPRYLVSQKIEDEIGTLLGGLRLADDWRQLVIERLSTKPSGEAIDPKPLLGKLERLKQLFVMGDIDLDSYRAQSEKIKAQLTAVETSATGTPHNIDQIVALLNDMPSIWSAATQEERKLLANMLIKKIWVVRGEIKAIEPTSVLWVLVDATCALSGRKGANHDSAHTIALWVAPDTTAQQIISRAA